MAVLSDKDIEFAVQRGRIRIDPFDPVAVQPSSYDVRLDYIILAPLIKQFDVVDPLDPPEDLVREANLPWILKPGDFVLGSTVEWVELDDKTVARIEGRSSLGRLGLVVHATAGYVDPGWKGQLTLEIGNLAPWPIWLRGGMKIGQISFLNLSSRAQRPYGSSVLGSKYQGQLGPTASKGVGELPDPSHAGGSET